MLGATPIFNIPTSTDYGILGSFIDSNTLFTFALDVAKQNGVAKVLAELNLTALSGSKAEFLAGENFPFRCLTKMVLPLNIKNMV